jgi:hypothetical protein
LAVEEFFFNRFFYALSWRLLALRAGDSRHVGFLVFVPAFARFAPASRFAPATGEISVNLFCLCLQGWVVGGKDCRMYDKSFYVREQKP